MEWEAKSEQAFQEIKDKRPSSASVPAGSFPVKGKREEGDSSMLVEDENAQLEQYVTKILEMPIPELGDLTLEVRRKPSFPHLWMVCSTPNIQLPLPCCFTGIERHRRYRILCGVHCPKAARGRHELAEAGIYD